MYARQERHVGHTMNMHNPVESVSADRLATPSIVTDILRTARPKQWVKNGFVFAALIFASKLGHADLVARTAVAFLLFCVLSSAVYFMNDALDVEADRRHPSKRHRPIASGEVTVRTAPTAGAVLVVAAIGLSFAARWQLSLLVGGYLLQTVLYSVWLKHEAVLDLACVASGFVLRTIAGGVAVGVTISPWFLIVAGSASLFMVTGKRHAEMMELGDSAGGHRLTLAMYSREFLSYVRAVASSVTILAYCLWAFEKSAAVGNPVWFELSIVPFVLGILRYALLLEQGRGGAPEELVLSDRVLLAMGALWALFFALAVHGS
jgi:decaprenyl-phosphate phosphoribosyltransferase